jgi:FixJ family two-component response regulator
MDKHKVLVVDDELEWTEVLTDLLESAGYDVNASSSFPAARERLLHDTYAVIVIDLDLEIEESGTQRSYEGYGLLSGLQFLESLSQKQGRAIVLSVHGEVEQMRQAFKRGAHDFIDKRRFDRNEFLRVVREAIDLWETGRTPLEKRELTSEEKKEYDRVTRQYLRGKSIKFDNSLHEVHPWAKESSKSD